MKHWYIPYFLLTLVMSSLPFTVCAEPMERYRFAGSEPGENLGAGLACMPPFGTGSTVSELLLGKPGFDVAGNVSVIHGGDGTTVLYSHSGTIAGDTVGSSVAALGDVNNDGLSDFVYGNPTADEAVVVLSPNGSNTINIFSSFAGPGSFFGNVVQGLFADANSNGFNDIIVTAPFHSGTPGSDIGFLGIYDGNTGVAIREIEGLATNDIAGISASSISDYDNNGIRDVLIGAPGANGDTGAVYIYSSSGTFSPLFVMNGISGTNANFGYSIAAIPDLDSDGFQEILVGAPDSLINGPDAGQAILYSGATRQVLCVIDGAPGDRFGRAVAAVGDQNDDGREDFAVGAPRANDTGGAVRIYSYTQGNQSCVLIHSLNAATGSNEQFGNRLAGKPGGLLQCDINGDSRDDFGVGALDQRINEDAGGAIYYVNIAPTPTPTTTPTTAPSPTPTVAATVTPTPPAGRAPRSATFSYRIDTRGNLSARSELNRNPSMECRASLLGRRTTSDLRNRGPIQTLVEDKPADQITRFQARALRKARYDPSGKPFIFHMLVRYECDGQETFYSNVFARKLNCGIKPPVTIRDWERRARTALN